MMFSVAPFLLPWWVYVALLSVVLILAVMRVTRVVMTDDLGQWLVLTPAYRWAVPREATLRQRYADEAQHLEALPEPSNADVERMHYLGEAVTDDRPLSPAARLVSGLTCPFCVGFHITWVMIVITLLVVVVPVVSIVWHVVLVSLAVNYVCAHLSARWDTPTVNDESLETP